MAGDAITEMARDLCKRFPDVPSRTLAKRLVRDTKGAITVEQARKRIMHLFGVNGKHHRKKTNPAFFRKPRKAGAGYAMPRSVAPKWTPHVVNVKGHIGIISDVHVPYHDEIAVTAAVSHLKDVGLSALLLNGDIADFYSISRYMKDPKQRDFKAELEAVREFVRWIRQEFPAIPIIYKLGNHEERWQHWLWQHAAEISDDPRMSLCAWLDFNANDVTLVEDQRPVMLGKLPVFHGHELPRGMAAPVNAARGVWMRIKGTGLVGHHHRSSNHTESDWRHKETASWSVGCLCDLTPEYSRVNGWNHGFAVATIHDGGTFDVQNYRVMTDGSVRTA